MGNRDGKRGMVEWDWRGQLEKGPGKNGDPIGLVWRAGSRANKWLGTRGESVGSIGCAIVGWGRRRCAGAGGMAGEWPGTRVAKEPGANGGGRLRDGCGDGHR